MSLSDADVQKQIKHMMAFIEQEANEKAEEIDQKAEEEFNIEKGRLVQNQRLKIMEYYERKEKQVELQKKIQSSNMLNQARLKALKVREDHVRTVMDEARKQLVASVRDPARYRDLLCKLMLQALLQFLRTASYTKDHPSERDDQLNTNLTHSLQNILCELLESEVTLRAKEVDSHAVSSLFPEIIAKYKEISGKDLVLKLDSEHFLPSECSGGVELVSGRGKIKIINTLESRLDLISAQLVPQIRTALFGRNPNRKFTD